MGDRPSSERAPPHPCTRCSLMSPLPVNTAPSELPPARSPLPAAACGTPRPKRLRTERPPGGRGRRGDCPGCQRKLRPGLRSLLGAESGQDPGAPDPAHQRGGHLPRATGLLGSFCGPPPPFCPCPQRCLALAASPSCVPSWASKLLEVADVMRTSSPGIPGLPARKPLSHRQWGTQSRDSVPVPPPNADPHQPWLVAQTQHMAIPPGLAANRLDETGEPCFPG